MGYEFKPSQGPGVRLVQRLKQLSRRHEHHRRRAHPPATHGVDPEAGGTRGAQERRSAGSTGAGLISVLNFSFYDGETFLASMLVAPGLGSGLNVHLNFLIQLGRSVKVSSKSRSKSEPTRCHQTFLCKGLYQQFSKWLRSWLFQYHIVYR